MADAADIEAARREAAEAAAAYIALAGADAHALEGDGDGADHGGANTAIVKEDVIVPVTSHAVDASPPPPPPPPAPMPLPDEPAAGDSTAAVPETVVVAAAVDTPAAAAPESVEQAEPAEPASLAKRRASKRDGDGTARRKAKRPSAVLAEAIANDAAEIATAKRKKKGGKKKSIAPSEEALLGAAAASGAATAAAASGAATEAAASGAAATTAPTAAAAAASGDATPAAPVPDLATAASSTAAPRDPNAPPAYDDRTGVPAPYEAALKLPKVKQRKRESEATDETVAAGSAAGAAAAAVGLSVATTTASGAAGTPPPASGTPATPVDGKSRNVIEVKNSVARSKANWSFHRGFMFAVFLLLAMYDLATDVLVFYNSYVFVRQINRSLINASLEVAGNPATNATYHFDPSCTNATYTETELPYDCILAKEPCVETMVFSLQANYSQLAPPVSENKTFWDNMDTQTNGSCNFYYLYAADTFETAFASMQVTLWITLGFVIVSFATFIWAVYTNWKYRHFGSSKILFTFLLFFVEDIPQMCLQLILFSRRIQLTCYTCVYDTECGLGPNAAQRWTPPNGDCTGTPTLASLSAVGETDQFDVFLNSLLNPLLLLYLSLAGIAFATLKLYARALSFKRCNVWLTVYLVLGPVILGCLWLPVLWTVYAFLLPTLGLANSPLRMGIFYTSIACSAFFPIAVLIVYQNVRLSILGGNDAKVLEERIQNARRSTSIEMGTMGRTNTTSRGSRRSPSDENGMGTIRSTRTASAGGSDQATPNYATMRSSVSKNSVGST